MMTPSPIPIISFFCGAGGLDLGFRHAGFETIFACDLAASAVTTFNLNAGAGIARVLDLAATTPNRMIAILDTLLADRRPIGLIGGPPCQGFSRGNSRANPDDPRNLLPFRFARLLKGLNRRYNLDFFVFENVMGLTKPRHATRFLALKRVLRRAGFQLFEGLLDAQAFGVAQKRLRLFLVGLNCDRFGPDAFSFPVGASAKKTIRHALSGLPVPTFFTRGLTGDDIGFHPNHWTMAPKSSKFADEVSTYVRSFRRLDWDTVSPTVAYGNREIPIHPDGGRRLSVLEAMLLQGFPRSYQLTGNFSQQVTQVCNAVPPPVARALALRLRSTLLRGAQAQDRAAAVHGEYA